MQDPLTLGRGGTLEVWSLDTSAPMRVTGCVRMSVCARARSGQSTQAADESSRDVAGPKEVCLEPTANRWASISGIRGRDQPCPRPKEKQTNPPVIPESGTQFQTDNRDTPTCIVRVAVAPNALALSLHKRPHLHANMHSPSHRSFLAFGCIRRRLRRDRRRTKNGATHWRPDFRERGRRRMVRGTKLDMTTCIRLLDSRSGRQKRKGENGTESQSRGSTSFWTCMTVQLCARPAEDGPCRLRRCSKRG